MKKEKQQEVIEKITETYNTIAPQWDGTRQHLWPFFADFLPYVKNDDAVLDIGCGNARLIKLFENVKVTYTGLDISEALITIAKRRYPEQKFILGDITNINFPEATFDVVFAIASIHHIPGRMLRQQTFENIYQFMKPGGYFIMVNWAWHSPKLFNVLLRSIMLKLCGLNRMEFGDIHIGFGQEKQSRYVHLFNHARLAKVLQKIGFTVVKNYYSTPSQRGFRNIVTIVKK